MKTYEGKLTISRIQGGDVDQGIEIAVRDEKSRIEFFTVRISLEEFAKGLFNLCERPCTFELRGVDKVGWVCWHKDVYVPVANSHGDEFVAEMRDEISCYCTDGWEASDYDLQYNYHRVLNGKMRVTMHRYVKE